MFIYWGYNVSGYSLSDIHFLGQNYNFTLYDVQAKDRPTPFSVKEYFSPVSFTIPQYNFRAGFFLNDKWSFSLGVDHMKYVMVQDQVAPIEGYIQIPDGEHNGNYNRQPKKLTQNFLAFEHTDGLNVISAELEYNANLYRFNDKFEINYYLGPAIGMVVPKSNINLMTYPRHDNFHISGVSASAKVGMQAVLFKYFTINLESKNGYISMQDILTTGYNVTDRARQSFWYTEFMWTFGTIFNLSDKD